MTLSYKILFTCCLLSVLLTNCKKDDSLKHEDLSAANFSQIFENFWNGINTDYVYWDIDTTNWDNKYRQFKPLFEKLDINNTADIDKSVSYFKQMTSSLIDSHFQILGQGGSFQGLNIFPAADRKKASLSYHDPYDYSKLDNKYFDSNTTDTSGTLNIKIATIQKKLLYFSCNEFSLAKAYSSDQNIHSLLDLFFQKATDNITNTAGIIMDVRNNFGGDLVDLNFLISHFLNKPLDFGFSRYKSNLGRLDYTPWIKASINPAQNSKKISCPIIVLVDNYTVSVAEAVAMCIHLLPNSTIIGEQTWGATGPLAPNEIFNDGQFQIGNLFSIYTSSAEFKYIDGKMYEGIGFSPDIPITFNELLLNNGVDSQLEKAISLFK
jgi:carboxyl-terminal processing protease